MLAVTPHSLFSQLLATTNLLSVSEGLPVPDISYICGIIQFVGLCDWLLLLGMLSGFVHVVAWIRTLSFLLLHSVLLDGSTAVCLFTRWMKNGLFLLGCHEQCCREPLCMSLCGCLHSFLWVLHHIHLGVDLLGHMVIPCLTF